MKLTIIPEDLRGLTIEELLIELSEMFTEEATDVDEHSKLIMRIIDAMESQDTSVVPFCFYI